MADSEGRYFFADLPAGDYYLRASKEGYARRDVRPAPGLRDRASCFSLGEGERRTDARLMLWKYGAIGGTVVDEAGEPVVGVAVYALVETSSVAARGTARWTCSPELVPTATTDDRGMFRLSQLTPATYVVVVPSTQTTCRSRCSTPRQNPASGANSSGRGATNWRVGKRRWVTRARSKSATSRC